MTQDAFQQNNPDGRKKSDAQGTNPTNPREGQPPEDRLDLKQLDPKSNDYVLETPKPVRNPRDISRRTPAVARNPEERKNMTIDPNNTQVGADGRPVTNDKNHDQNRDPSQSPGASAASKQTTQADGAGSAAGGDNQSNHAGASAQKNLNSTTALTPQQQFERQLKQRIEELRAQGYSEDQLRQYAQEQRFVKYMQAQQQKAAQGQQSQPQGVGAMLVGFVTGTLKHIAENPIKFLITTGFAMAVRSSITTVAFGMGLASPLALAVVAAMATSVIMSVGKKVLSGKTEDITAKNLTRDALFAGIISGFIGAFAAKIFLPDQVDAVDAAYDDAKLERANAAADGTAASTEASTEAANKVFAEKGEEGFVKYLESLGRNIPEGASNFKIAGDQFSFDLKGQSFTFDLPQSQPGTYNVFTFGDDSPININGVQQFQHIEGEGHTVGDLTQNTKQALAQNNSKATVDGHDHEHTHKPTKPVYKPVAQPPAPPVVETAPPVVEQPPAVEQPYIPEMQFYPPEGPGYEEVKNILLANSPQIEVQGKDLGHAFAREFMELGDKMLESYDSKVLGGMDHDTAREAVINQFEDEQTELMAAMGHRQLKWGRQDSLYILQMMEVGSGGVFTSEDFRYMDRITDANEAFANNEMNRPGFRRAIKAARDDFDLGGDRIRRGERHGIWEGILDKANEINDPEHKAFRRQWNQGGIHTEAGGIHRWERMHVNLTLPSEYVNIDLGGWNQINANETAWQNYEQQLQQQQFQQNLQQGGSQNYDPSVDYHYGNASGVNNSSLTNGAGQTAISYDQQLHGQQYAAAAYQNQQQGVMEQQLAAELEQGTAYQQDYALTDIQHGQSTIRTSANNSVLPGHRVVNQYAEVDFTKGKDIKLGDNFQLMPNATIDITGAVPDETKVIFPAGTALVGFNGGTVTGYDINGEITGKAMFDDIRPEYTQKNSQALDNKGARIINGVMDVALGEDPRVAVRNNAWWNVQRNSQQFQTSQTVDPDARTIRELIGNHSSDAVGFDVLPQAEAQQRIAELKAYRASQPPGQGINYDVLYNKAPAAQQSSWTSQVGGRASGPMEHATRLSNFENGR
jgi:hypothetical protein